MGISHYLGPDISPALIVSGVLCVVLGYAAPPGGKPMPKVSVEWKCSHCGAEGEGWRDRNDIGTEECWRCHELTYEPMAIDADKPRDADYYRG